MSFSLFEEGSKIPSIIEQECKKILISKLDNWKEYVELPEFKKLMKCLEKGVGVHHAGIIGVFKEMMEILFHKGYIKVRIDGEMKFHYKGKRLKLIYGVYISFL